MRVLSRTLAVPQMTDLELQDNVEPVVKAPKVFGGLGNDQRSFVDSSFLVAFHPAMRRFLDLFSHLPFWDASFTNERCSLIPPVPCFTRKLDCENSSFFPNLHIYFGDVSLERNRKLDGSHDRRCEKVRPAITTLESLRSIKTILRNGILSLRGLCRPCVYPLMQSPKDPTQGVLVNFECLSQKAKCFNPGFPIQDSTVQVNIIRKILALSAGSRVNDQDFGLREGNDGLMVGESSELSSNHKDSGKNDFMRRRIVRGGVSHINSWSISDSLCPTREWIPSSMVAIDAFRFAGCSELKSVVIEKGSELKEIKKCAFWKSGLLSIFLPSSIRIIGEKSFDGCSLETIGFETESKLEIIQERSYQFIGKISIVFPASLSVIGRIAFMECQILSVCFERGSQLKQIEFCAFGGSLLRSIVIPASVVTICDSAFTGCYDLESVVFERDSRLEEIGPSAFLENFDLNSIDIPSSVLVLGNSCFARCLSLFWVTFGLNSRLKHIGTWAFMECPFDSILIPSSVAMIAASVFSEAKVRTIEFEGDASRFCIFESFLVDFSHGCLFCCFGSPVSIVIPSSITVIGDEAFSGSKIESVTFESGSQMKLIGVRTFSRCSLRSILLPASVLVLGAACFLCCSRLDSVVFEDDSHLMRIERECFAWSSLKSFVIPSSAEYIHGSAFYGVCFQSLAISEGESRFRICVPFLQDFSGRSIYRYCGSESSIVIPSSVSVLLQSSFSGCSWLSCVEFESGSHLERIERMGFERSGLKSIVIPSSITTLCDCSFTNNSIEFLTFEHNSKLQEIGVRAFQGNPLTSVVIPASVVVLWDGCFSYCSSLKSLTIESDSVLEWICDMALCNTGLESITIPRSVTHLGSSCFKSCLSLQFVHFENGSRLEKINRWTFMRSIISSIMIPSCVVTLGKLCFSESGLLESVSFERPSHLEEIGEHAFLKTQVKSIVIPGSLRVLGPFCFSPIDDFTPISMTRGPPEREPTGIESITFEPGSKLERIHESAFLASALRSIVIPPLVRVLETSCFAWCRFLESVSFSQGSILERLEAFVFAGSGLKEIILPSSLSEFSESCFWCCESLNAIRFDSEIVTGRPEIIMLSPRRSASIIVPYKVSVLSK
jgi:hypothetical protein